MCLEDVKLGDKSKPNEFTVAVTTAQAELVPANSYRRHLRISAPQANGLILHFGKVGSATQGMLVPPGTRPFELDIETDGLLVVGAIFASMLVAGESITFWETLLRR